MLSVPHFEMVRTPQRWAVALFAGAGLVLVPWGVLLLHILPRAHEATHWDVAWAGFDGALALVLMGLAVAAWRRSPWLQTFAAATATLLFVDAWFDILTSSSRAELIVAVTEAVLVELPLAILSLYVARPRRRAAAAAS